MKPRHLSGLETNNIDRLGEDLINKGLESLVITAGGQGSYYFEKDFKMMRKPREVKILSASGAGDAFMAGYAYGLYNDLEIEERMAAAEAAARITLMSSDSCSKDMNNMSSREFGDNISDYLGINETINGQKLEINSYAEVGLGFARNITDRLAVGGKVKMLLGIGNLKLNINQIHVETPSVGSSGVTSKASIQVDATLENSSKLLELPENENGDYIDEIDFGSFGFAGYGGAIDLGVSYKLLDKLTLSASVLDLGFIKWSKSNTSIARANAEQTYDLLDPASQQEFMNIVNSGEILNYDMLKLKTEEASEKSRTRGLTSTMVLGAEYALLNDWLVVGALYTGRFAKPKTLNELTFSACIRPTNAFNVAASYSVLQGAGKTFGLALKLGPFFAGTDYMFFGKNTKNVNAYLGVSIPLGKQKTAEN